MHVSKREDERRRDSRAHGVEFGELREKLGEHDYPTTTAELIEAYGDAELTFPAGSETLSELLEPLGEDEYGSAEEVEGSILNMVGEEAIGRKNYSDRTPPAPGEEREPEGAPGETIDEGNESF